MLDILAGFLEQTILHLLKLGFDIVEVGESCRRLLEKYFGRCFVCFTLDDGHPDNCTTAYLVLLNITHILPSMPAQALPDGTVFWWV